MGTAGVLPGSWGFSLSGHGSSLAGYRAESVSVDGLWLLGMQRSLTWHVVCPQLGANALLFVGVNMYGVFVRILTERSQRKAFLQARSCIEDRLRLEDENEKQVSGPWSRGPLPGGPCTAALCPGGPSA